MSFSAEHVSYQKKTAARLQGPPMTFGTRTITCAAQGAASAMLEVGGRSSAS